MKKSSDDDNSQYSSAGFILPNLSIKRRQAILMGAAGLIVASCGGGSSSTSNSAANAATNDTSSTTTTSSGSSSCVLSPQVTEGPYFVDEKLNRGDITADSDGSSIQSGVPLELRIQIFSVNGTACTALSGYQIDIWHASAYGLYSDIGSNQGQANSTTTGHNYLRGYQLSDDSGLVIFKTIYPGFYSGRTVHIHIKARLYDSSNNKTFEATTQMFFDDAINDEVLANAPYNTRGSRDTRNSADNIYDGQTELLAALTANADNSGYIGTFNLGLDLS
jgi:protocatechuate 3,4-dioxygenase beta subunit